MTRGSSIGTAFLLAGMIVGLCVLILNRQAENAIPSKQPETNEPETSRFIARERIYLVSGERPEVVVVEAATGEVLLKKAIDLGESNVHDYPVIVPDGAWLDSVHKVLYVKGTCRAGEFFQLFDADSLYPLGRGPVMGCSVSMAMAIRPVCTTPFYGGIAYVDLQSDENSGGGLLVLDTENRCVRGAVPDTEACLRGDEWWFSNVGRFFSFVYDRYGVCELRTMDIKNSEIVDRIPLSKMIPDGKGRSGIMGMKEDIAIVHNVAFSDLPEGDKNRQPMHRLFLYDTARKRNSSGCMNLGTTPPVYAELIPGKDRFMLLQETPPGTPSALSVVDCKTLERVAGIDLGKDDVVLKICRMSPSGDSLYCLSADGVLFILNLVTYELCRSVDTHMSGAVFLAMFVSGR